MEQLQILNRKIASAQDLLSVVKTMKALAAVNIREYEEAVDSLGDYSCSMELGFQVLMKNMPETDSIKSELSGSTAAVVIGSEQGMVGQFNEHIASFAIAKMDELGIPEEQRTLLALGRKLVDGLQNRGQPVEDHIAAFGSMVDVTSVVQEVLIRIEGWREKGRADQIIVFFNRPESGTAYEPHMRYLYPLDLTWLRSLQFKKWPSRVLPAFTMPWEQLFASFTRHYFFLTLYKSAVESLTSENASRLASMQAAEKNIEERLEELRNRHQHLRQETITAELLDIVSGFEVLRTDNDKEDLAV